jgi:hypothetical protein
MSQFCHVSMLIDLDFESWTPALAAYTRTSHYFPKRSRALVHESIHYWQQLSQGYLLRLAEEDWKRMIEWERNGGPASVGPYRAHYYEPEGRHGFTAYQLCESFARFWEVLRAGPSKVLSEAIGDARKKGRAREVNADWKEAVRPGAPADRTFDLAMDAGGSYGLPYAVARRVLDRESGLVIFPFLAHFALKTSRPAYFFDLFLDEAAPAAAAEAEVLGVFAQPARAGAEMLYPFVEGRCAEIARREGEAGLLHAAYLFRDSPLRRNPVYDWSFRRLRRRGLAGKFDCALGLFGLHFGELASQLTPPCIRFRDQHTIGLSHDYLQADGGASWLALRRAERAKEACLRLQRRWEQFQGAMRSSSGGPATG